MDKPLKDQPLFGPVDQVINTLEMESSWVKAEIKRCEKSIARMKSEIEILGKRKSMIDESMKIVREAERKRQEAEGRPLAATLAGTKGKKPGEGKKNG